MQSCMTLARRYLTLPRLAKDMKVFPRVLELLCWYLVHAGILQPLIVSLIYTNGRFMHWVRGIATNDLEYLHRRVVS